MQDNFGPHKAKAEMIFKDDQVVTCPVHGQRRSRTSKDCRLRKVHSWELLGVAEIAPNVDRRSGAGTGGRYPGPKWSEMVKT